ncbi:MAG: hypothetical protein JJD98_02465 [Polaromonas sp.]|nr:hypothetical protein [Polaromonas sp.]
MPKSSNKTFALVPMIFAALAMALLILIDHLFQQPGSNRRLGSWQLLKYHL